MRALCLGLSLLAAGPAFATGSLECQGIDDNAVVASLLLTRSEPPVLMPLRAEIVTVDTTWSTVGVEGAKLVDIVHTYADERSAIVEFADPATSEILISLRLARGVAADSYAEAGVLVIVGVGAYAVACIDG
ncbi:hypothetical protein [Acuticoccus mangrovi]|uniref:Uncharacterized protein n=1 Tax=Acuticoccus mangrovi TaxID=2796142 RepID=A0A934MEZ8_9HYPH|nr:hypothetical protein [Acuticoccus mangrovi]MBJ3774928.1 hypothetical protein [Acuticoccus mangrovi]